MRIEQVYRTKRMILLLRFHPDAVGELQEILGGLRGFSIFRAHDCVAMHCISKQLRRAEIHQRGPRRVAPKTRLMTSEAASIVTILEALMSWLFGRFLGIAFFS